MKANRMANIVQILVVFVIVFAGLNQVVSPSPVLAQTQTQTCTPEKHGTLAWQNDALPNDASHNEGIIGGLDEPCGVVAQTWWHDESGTPHRVTFFVPPHSVLRINGHVSGTGWYFNPQLADVQENLDDQLRQIHERGDEEMVERTVIFPEDTFELVTSFITKPNIGLAEETVAEESAEPAAEETETEPVNPGVIYNASYAREVCGDRSVDSFDPQTGTVECASDEAEKPADEESEAKETTSRLGWWWTWRAVASLVLIAGVVLILWLAPGWWKLTALVPLGLLIWLILAVIF